MLDISYFWKIITIHAYAYILLRFCIFGRFLGRPYLKRSLEKLLNSIIIGIDVVSPCQKRDE